MAKPKLKILLIEDDPLVIESVNLLLGAHDMRCYSSLRHYLFDLAATGPYDLVLLDLCHPGDPTGQGTVEDISKLKQRCPGAELVVQSGLQEVALMRRSLKLGADKFVLKDHLAEELPLLLEQISERQNAKNEILQSLLGSSLSMQDLRRQLVFLKFQPQLDVLLEGETGTGKELCAKAVHGDGPFVAINVSAIPKELFEAEFFGAEKGAYTGAAASRMGHLENARKGTLFLDEIQSLDLSLQAKLLRVLETRTFMRVGSSQDRHFEGRIVAASNQQLRENIQKGLFREDLYYRLAQAKVSLPPLRVRGGDILQLAEAFLKEFDHSKKIKFTAAAKEWLQNGYDWPGNVRELRAVIRRLVVESKMPFIDYPELNGIVASEEQKEYSELNLGHGDRSESFVPNLTVSFDSNVADFERFLLSKLLREHSSSELREKFKLSRTRFYEKLKLYGIHAKSGEKPL